MSLTANSSLGFPISSDLSFDSIIIRHTNNITVDSVGNVRSNTAFDLNNCKAWVVVENKNNHKTDTCQISIVPWVANLSHITIESMMDNYLRIIGKSNDSILFIYKNQLYKTLNDLDFKKARIVSAFNNPLLYYAFYKKTPHGSFIKSGLDIYFSKDENSWNKEFSTKGYGMANIFDYKYDSFKRLTYVFAADYIAGTPDSIRCCLYRKIISDSGVVENWKKILEYSSLYEWNNNHSLTNAIRHFHVLAIDPFTGHIWAGTGDNDNCSRIIYSTDNGDTWNQVGWCSQDWRVLSIWFTKGFIYWSTDTSSPQSVFRISRDVFNKNNCWPSITKRLISGSTKIGLRYYIEKSNLEGFTAGDQWTASYSQKIDSINFIVHSINDPTFDYREKVASLINSALWDTKWVYNDRGDSLILLTSDGEGQYIDKKVRIFGILERRDNTVDVQELLTGEYNGSNKNNLLSRYQLLEQTQNGKIYLNSFGLKTYNYNSLQTSLVWNDNSSVQTGNIIVTKPDSITEILKLVNNNGRIFNWQIAYNNPYSWENINDSCVLIDNSLIIKRDKRNKYVRVLVQYNNECPEPSKYIKVNQLPLDQLINNKDLILFPNIDYVISLNKTNNSILLRILNGDNSEKVVKLFSTEGKMIYCSNGKKNEYLIPITNKGVYLLSINSKFKRLIYKLIF